MNTPSELDCVIYVASEKDPIELATTIAHVTGGKIGDGPTTTVGTEICEIDVVENDDFDSSRANFPDDFIHFRYRIEIYGTEESVKELRLKVTPQLLDAFWSKDTPAVASCDYPEILSEGGGYNSRNVPWPE